MKEYAIAELFYTTSSKNTLLACTFIFSADLPAWQPPPPSPPLKPAWPPESIGPGPGGHEPQPVGIVSRPTSLRHCVSYRIIRSLQVHVATPKPPTFRGRSSESIGPEVFKGIHKEGGTGRCRSWPILSEEARLAASSSLASSGACPPGRLLLPRLL